MTRLIAPVFALMLFAAPVMAQPMPMECQLLPVHTAKDDVAYKPGVDVKGKPVVPADLNAAAPDLPRTIMIPLSVDLAGRLQNSTIAGLKLEAPLGMLEIHPNGRVVYDDKDLTPQVYALCGRENIPSLPAEAAQGAQKAAGQPTTADGQAAADTIKSDAIEVAPAQAIPPDSVVIEGGEGRQEGYK